MNTFQIQDHSTSSESHRGSKMKLVSMMYPHSAGTLVDVSAYAALTLILEMWCRSCVFHLYYPGVYTGCRNDAQQAWWSYMQHGLRNRLECWCNFMFLATMPLPFAVEHLFFFFAQLPSFFGKTAVFHALLVIKYFKTNITLNHKELLSLRYRSPQCTYRLWPFFSADSGVQIMSFFVSNVAFKATSKVLCLLSLFLRLFFASQEIRTPQLYFLSAMETRKICSFANKTNWLFLSFVTLKLYSTKNAY